MKRITFYLTAFLLFGFAVEATAQSVVINEILTSNTSVNTDEDGEYQDWVELYNSGASAVNLDGYGLTDDASVPFKWVFPAVTMQPGSFLLIYCSDKNRTVVGQPLHTNWKISSGGEVITLTNAASVTESSYPATVIPQNMSSGHSPDGTGPLLFFPEPTPGASNNTAGYSEILPEPTFSQEGGFHAAGFDLTLSTTVADAVIYYTLDGSEPSEDNLGGTTYQYKNVYAEHPGDVSGPLLTQSYQSMVYSGPIAIVDRSPLPNKIANISTTYDNDPTYIPTEPLFKGTVVRAKIVKPGALASPIATKTYFITAAGSAEFALPVISISLNEDRFFDYEDGIQVAGIDFDTWRAENPTEEPLWETVGNFYRRGSANEKIGNFTYFVNGAEVLNQDVGIRSRGGNSCAFPQKAMNIYARAELGEAKLDYKFFNDLEDDSFARIMLRNGGGDFYGTMFRDELNQTIVDGLNCEIESYQPAVVFLNGEYWGILNIREKYDNNYFERVIGNDDIDFLEDEGIWEANIEEGDNLDFIDMNNYINNNSLVPDANYAYIQTRMDINSFMDYQISNIFLDNADWPGTNQHYWRTRNPYNPSAPYGNDGRWRWAFHDLDDTLGVGSGAIEYNSLAAATATDGPEWPNPAWSTLYLRKFLENPAFQQNFINRFADLMNTNFLSTRMMGFLTAYETQLEPEIQGHIDRWDTLLPGDYEWLIDWESDFLNQRPALQRDHIRAKFAIASNIDATLDVSDAAHGYIHLNTIDIKDGTPGITGNPYPWTGVYFSNIPVTLTAVANDGFAFSHWEGASTSTEATITIDAAASFSVTAIFEPTAIATSEPIYFWMMDSNIPNDTPLLSLNSTFELEGIDASIAYQSCLVGYPFDSTHPNWRTASMERRNRPTSINYIPEANNDVPYADGIMRGIQITEPLHNNGLENTMVFNISSVGYADIKFAFAAMNELTNATGIAVDYAINAGEPVWITTDLAATTLTLGAAYQLFEVDFASIAAADNNANLKIRLRFVGSGDMTVANGNRITFNNISVHGTQTTMGVKENPLAQVAVYPNPFSDMLYIKGIDNADYEIFSIDGKLVQQGKTSAQLNLGNLRNGMYLLRLSANGASQTKKIIKK
ncbi:CotH kinase family protein [Flavobacterium caeni]|uniref:Por secretion system C-terminal sorting domain-containing protein n=1 Tax=Flavobacterium caeni TaxID=490189 RepID=A0A1G5JB97_9FLAO|nr:CotH kinase family protein [Flavobacterium caeni]SCY85615.1 Por secretion system C-terminal sorting domain-containing protein [Flavobacterium caeni]